MQVCNPTTPAQIFHLLRRQMIRAYRQPLIIMSPKSLLRHKSAVSTLEDLAEGAFLTVLEEQEKSDPKKVDRVVMCSGKVYYELLEKKQEAGLDNVALLRIEQLHPFPNDRMGRRLTQYEHVKTFYWCQEEPINQGAWYSIQHNLRNVIDNRSLECACRDASASPATGYAKVHKEQQQNLIKIALGCSE
jgi:2-oxoglutarate dehydrogenase E1 component